MPVLVPKGITRTDEGVLIDWDGQGHTALYPARELRLACPCAECVEEMTGRPLLDPVSIADSIRPVTLALVGAYGLTVHWNDGHSTGIYTFERLLAGCPCPRCAAGPRLVPEKGGL